MKYDTNGIYQWHTRYGGSLDGILFDGSSRLYAVGNDAGRFTGDHGEAPLHETGEGGHFVLALGSANALYQWHTFYGRTSWHVAHALALDAARNLYVTGDSGVPWTGDNNTPPLLSQEGGNAVFVQKFSLQTTPILTWANPADIVFGSALGPAQLNASAGRVAGTYTYTPTAGTVLPVGNGQTLSVWFTPADAVTYASASKTVTINVLPVPPEAPARLVVTHNLTRVNGQIVARVTIANTGGSTAENIRLTVARINTTAGTPLPQALGSVAAGATATATVSVPGTVGNPGAAAVVSLAGTYTGGSFNSASRAALP